MSHTRRDNANGGDRYISLLDKSRMIYEHLDQPSKVRVECNE